MTISSIGVQSDDWTSQLLESFQSRKKNQGDDLADKLMGDLDQDGTSTLSLEESGLSESVFSAADADGDGQISATELDDALKQERAQMMAGSATQGASLLGTLLSQAGVSMPQGMGNMQPPDDSKMAEDLISTLDTDGDSGLSLTESGLSQTAFDALDTDQDGVVSATELAAGLKSERQQMEASGNMGGAGGASGTASNAGTESLLKTLMDKAGLSPEDMMAQGSQTDQSSQVDQMSPAQLRKALQAYGSNLLSTILGQYDGTSGLSYDDALSSGQMSLLNYLGTESVDYTV